MDGPAFGTSLTRARRPRLLACNKASFIFAIAQRRAGRHASVNHKHDAGREKMGSRLQDCQSHCFALRYKIAAGQTGNPYGKLLAGLMEQGVQIELCGATAAANHWGNADLIPGVKINTNAMVRVTQLEQDGLTLIYE
jgi:DsrE/DsrF-like family